MLSWCRVQVGSSPPPCACRLHVGSLPVAWAGAAEGGARGRGKGALPAMGRNGECWTDRLPIDRIYSIAIGFGAQKCFEAAFVFTINHIGSAGIK